MHNGKYTSIKSILYEISKYPFVEGIQAEDIALYLTNLLSLVGSPFAFSKKIEQLKINNNRVEIPCDLVRIEGTRYRICDNDNFIPLLYASGLYHPLDKSVIHSDTCPDFSCSSDQTYSVNNSMIYTSFPQGEIQIAYQSIVIDEDGLPMIPDSAAFRQALKYYILMQYAEPARYRNEVPRDVYEDITKQYMWYIGAASNDLNMLTLDKAKTLENGIIRLFQGMDHHSDMWNSFTKKESFRK